VNRQQLNKAKERGKTALNQELTQKDKQEFEKQMKIV
jgi:hypothetical protein